MQRWAKGDVEEVVRKMEKSIRVETRGKKGYIQWGVERNDQYEKKGRSKDGKKRRKGENYHIRGNDRTD